jgi:hypothetical protein
MLGWNIYKMDLEESWPLMVVEFQLILHFNLKLKHLSIIAFVYLDLLLFFLLVLIFMDASLCIMQSQRKNQGYYCLARL